jgi:two-component system phosphate regulon sensor histidine kinase PhoR
MENGSDINRVRYQPASDDNFYFGVSFPQKRSYIASQMKIWLVFTALLLSVIFFFSYALFAIFKQKRLSEIKTDFINNMTHELKTPLATISASSEVLMKTGDEGNGKVGTYAGIINQESKRLKQQIESVLKISVLDSGSLSMKKQEIDLTGLLSKVAGTYRPIIESMNGVFNTELHDGPLLIYADPAHLENVFHNLVENAVKYSGDSIQISMRSEIRNGKVIVAIADKGIGIPGNMQKKIFDKFFRVPTGNVHDTKGFGLGLYYVSKIIRSHRGSIRLESEEGNGTDFTIALPLLTQEV